MRKLNETDWHVGSEEARLKVAPKETVNLEVHGHALQLALINSSGEPVPVETGNSIHFRATLSGWSEILITGQGNFGFRMHSRNRQVTEPLDELPAPIPAEPSNLLAKMRQRVRQEMGPLHEAFAERDVELPGYEVPDDYPEMFEETEHQIINETKKRKKDAANNRSDTSPAPSDGSPAPDDTEPAKSE